MKLREIYELIVQLGKEADPRGSELEKVLEKAYQEERDLPEDERKYFDRDKLFNPYSDTRILYGDDNLEVKTILAGIDIETSEILLADRLREKGTFVDLIIAHHPEGKALTGLYEVMKIQEDVLYNFGVPINIAQGLLTSRISEVERNLLPLNHNRSIDAAKLLNIPLMCAHTPADNQVQYFLNKLFTKKSPDTLGEVVKVLLEVPEYDHAAYMGSGPKIVVGDKKRKAGKIFVDMTGGTSGSEKAYEKMAMAGIGTVVCMHMDEKHRKEAEKNFINVVIAGHMASDSLGMNLILDKIEEQGIKVLTCSGLIRVPR